MATKQAGTRSSLNIAEMAAAEMKQNPVEDGRQRLRTLYLDRVAGRTGRRLRNLMGRHTRRG